MPRKARIDAPGALHHIFARGIDRRSIFKDDADRADFLKRVETILSETQTACYAWALIPNHFHLLLRTGPSSISTVMRNTVSGARRRYREFVRKGVNQGRRSELAGGGCGWSAVNVLRHAGFRQKADERILGDGDFVTTVLKQAGEQFERRYDLKAKGCNFDTVVERVAQLLGMESNQVLTNSKNRQSVRMSREVHVRFCESLGVRLPRAPQLVKIQILKFH
jgi:REP element-mobilizing transposase RayT